MLNSYKTILRIICCIIIFSITSSGFAQEKEKLKKEKQRLQEEINYTNSLLQETKKNTQTSLNQVIILNKKIESRKKLISAIEDEIRNTDNDINYKKETISNLNTELQNLKNVYSKMAYIAYKNRNVYNKLMFVFASKDFNQAYRRLRYIQQYNSYLKKQAELIQQTENKIKRKVNELNEIKYTKVILKKNNENENQILITEKKQQNTSINELQKKQKQLQKTLREKEKAAANLQKQIESIIAKEIAASYTKKDVVKNPVANKFSLTPDEQKLSNTFAGNKGRLPWPTVKGIISSSFGEHAHPVLKGIKTKNNGVDIATEPGSDARAVYDGKATAVISVPGGDKAIIIRHGDYLTVYSNLESVYINKGDKVAMKQRVGKVVTDKGDNKTELHFELWQGKTLLNPMDWLAR